MPFSTALFLVAATRNAAAEGAGIKLGDSLVLHPGFSLGGGYDSNVFYATGTVSDAVQGSAYVMATPSIESATPPGIRSGNTAHTLDFRLHLAVPLRFFANSNRT